MPASELSFLDLSYRPDLRVLNVRWLRDVSFEELQAGFEAVRELARARQASRWVVDVRRRTRLDGVQTEWIAQQMLPQVAQALAPTPLFIAYLLAPSRVSTLHLPPTLLPPQEPAPAPTAAAYKLRTFAEEGPALQWLLGQP